MFYTEKWWSMKILYLKLSLALIVCTVFNLQTFNYDISSAEEDNRSLINLIDKITLGISKKEALLEFAIVIPKPIQLTENIYGAIYKEGQAVVMGLFTVCSNKLVSIQAMSYSKNKNLIDGSFLNMKKELDNNWAVKAECPNDNICFWNMEAIDYSLSLAKAYKPKIKMAVLVYQRRKDSLVFDNPSCLTVINSELKLAVKKLNPDAYIK